MPKKLDNEDHSIASSSLNMDAYPSDLSQTQVPQSPHSEFHFPQPTPAATPERTRNPTNKKLESKTTDSKSETPSSESETTKSKIPSTASSASTTSTTTETRKPIFDLAALGFSITSDQVGLLTPPSSRSQSPEPSSTKPNQEEKTSNSNNNISSQSVHDNSDQVTPSPTSQKFQSAQSSASIVPTPTLKTFNNLFPSFSPLSRVQERPGCCIANAKNGKGRRCTNPVKWLEVHNIATLLEDLSTHAYGTEEDAKVLGVANRLLCRRWHQIGGQKPDKPRNKSTAIDNRTAAVVVNTTLTIPLITTIPYTLRSGRTTYTNNNPHKFTPWQPASMRNLDISTAIANLIRKPLTSTGGQEGWLYVYWNQSNFGLRKIGFTTKVVATRLRAWEGQCGHSAVQVCRGSLLQSQQQQKPDIHSLETNPNTEVKVKKEVEMEEAEEEIKVPHIRRLEALVHATFKESRYCEPICTACKKRHVEWFDVGDDEKIKRVIAFWKKWIRREPYEFVDVESGDNKYKERGRKKGQWRLKANFEGEVEETCCRIQAELTVKKEEPPRPRQKRISSDRGRTQLVGNRRSSRRRVSV